MRWLVPVIAILVTAVAAPVAAADDLLYVDPQQLDAGPVVVDPSVEQALGIAAQHFGRSPACAGGIVVHAVPALGALGLGERGGCRIWLDAAWLASPPSRADVCTLVTHEFGHLLDVPHDPQPGTVMSAEPAMPPECEALAASAPVAKAATRRTTEPTRIRRLYAAGRRAAACRAYARWRARGGRPATWRPRGCHN